MTKRTTDKRVVQFLVCASRSKKPLDVRWWYWLPADAHRHARQLRERDCPTACVRVGREVNGEWVTL